MISRGSNVSSRTIVLASAFLAVLLGRFRSTAFLVPKTMRLWPDAVRTLRSSHQRKYHSRNHDNEDASALCGWAVTSGRPRGRRRSTAAASSSSDVTDATGINGDTRDVERNTAFVKGLMSNLQRLCDKYICNGSAKIREQIFNVLDQIAAEAIDKDLVRQSIRTVKRAGVPIHKTYLENYQNELELGKNDAGSRRSQAETRKGWETIQNGSLSSTPNGGKSALSRRMAEKTNGGRPDLFTPSILDPESIAYVAKDQSDLRAAMNGNTDEEDAEAASRSALVAADAASKVSEIISRAGGGSAFEGQSLGVGGLDDVLAQIKRRIWTPLAAPPQLLKELGISPARGLLLYGKPGCGKSLLASALGSMLSPFRPITVVSGPEVLDKFVGSSEKNLRDIFDNPPDIYPRFRTGDDGELTDEDDALASAALHVVVMDEFDAVARSRGGSDGKGGQGDAGVARDSVVNQLLAKMDGVQPLVVPTLVIGLTNKRSLIEPALLRPGRFEVQIEIPPPKTTEQRVSILRVHTKLMLAAGRLQVSDPPEGSTAAKLLLLEKGGEEDVLSYEDLLTKLAEDSDGFSGAAIAAIARAAASRALERAVEEQAEGTNGTIMDSCLITQGDFHDALDDVRGSMGSHDHTEDDEDEDANDGDDENENDTKSDDSSA
mmetsp:Transcript_27901/g.65592  ORF Transcript_27901/g.65592 Transcript_27901/m.65592 type:complete len:661 (-) Transcript_27901:121-2103(-)